MGKVATPALEMVAVPYGLGVSLRVVRALTNPASRVTWVVLPLDRSATEASGFFEALLLLLLEQALRGRARTAAAVTPMATFLKTLMSVPFHSASGDGSSFSVAVTVTKGSGLNPEPVRFGSKLGCDRDRSVTCQ